MFVVYILYSEQTTKYYIGHTDNFEKRLGKHNQGRVRSTKSGVPWSLVYTEEYASKHEAYRRELKIKAYKGGEAFKKLIKK